MVDIVITIPNDKVNELKLGFLKAYPIPKEHGIPQYTEMEWTIVWIKEQLMRAYKEGKNIIAHEGVVPVYDENAIL